MPDVRAALSKESRFSGAEQRASVLRVLIDVCRNAESLQRVEAGRQACREVASVLRGWRRREQAIVRAGRKG